MTKNIIFYFSGTGNSLKVAKDISLSLENCEVVLMNKAYKLLDSYDRIGFVFPTYGMGVPKIVENFIVNLDFSKNQKSYLFAVATYGGNAGNSLSGIDKKLKSRGVSLSYGAVIRMFANYVALYPMAENVDEKTAKANVIIKDVVNDVADKKIKQNFKSLAIFNLTHKFIVGSLASKSKNFNISDSCIGCKKCVNVCPVNNITMKNGKPSFDLKCEQCMACVQWCPKQAINYKNVTQQRGRYHHPEVSYQDMARK